MVMVRSVLFFTQVSPLPMADIRGRADLVWDRVAAAGELGHGVLGDHHGHHHHNLEIERARYESL